MPLRANLVFGGVRISGRFVCGKGPSSLCKQSVSWMLLTQVSHTFPRYRVQRLWNQCTSRHTPCLETPSSRGSIAGLGITPIFGLPQLGGLGRGPHGHVNVEAHRIDIEPQTDGVACGVLDPRQGPAWLTVSSSGTWRNHHRPSRGQRLDDRALEHEDPLADPRGRQIAPLEHLPDPSYGNACSAHARAEELDGSRSLADLWTSSSQDRGAT